MKNIQVGRRSLQSAAITTYDSAIEGVDLVFVWKEISCMLHVTQPTFS